MWLRFKIPIANIAYRDIAYRDITYRDIALLMGWLYLINMIHKYDAM